MRASIFIAMLGAVSLGAVGGAFAQTPLAGDTTVNPPTVDMNPPGGYASSNTLGDASKMKAGDPGVVSNAPVPDTPENRDKYGRPMSHAGKVSSPAGN